MSGLLLGVAVDDHIIRRSNGQPGCSRSVHLERIVHEEVRDRSEILAGFPSLAARRFRLASSWGLFSHPAMPNARRVVATRLHEQIMMSRGPRSSTQSLNLRAANAPWALRPGRYPSVGMEDRLKQQHRGRGLGHPQRNPDMILR